MKSTVRNLLLNLKFKPIIWSVIIFILTIFLVLLFNSVILNQGSIADQIRNVIIRGYIYFILFTIILIIITGILIAIYSDNTEENKTQESNEELINYLKTANEELEAKAYQISRLNDELIELNHKKDKLFSIISHDLKGPLGGFINLTDILFNEFEEISIQEYQDISEILNFTARHVYELLENLLDWSRSQTGTIPFKPEKINLAVLVQNKFDLLKVNAAKKKIELAKDFHVNLNVFADENMLKTILANLISNAIKFSNEYGRIVVSAEDKGSYTCINVSDNGIGIDKDIIPNLFNIDKKVSTLGTGKEKGTGLGLILCKEFVEMHGGTISVQSEPEKGSTFTFSLPNPKNLP